MIYFIQSEKGGPIKIGFANHIGHRLDQLQTAHPYKLICLASMEGQMYVEQRLHDKFAKYRLLGEWFEPSDELMKFIENIDDFDPRSLPDKPRKQLDPIDIPMFVEELYAAALDNGWSYETAAETFKKVLYKRGYSVTQTVKHMAWFESNHRTRFEEKRAVSGLRLDVL